MTIGPLNGLVLGAAAIVSSPALWMSLVDGTLPLGDALTRYLISVLVCWAALNVVAQLAFPAREPAPLPVEPMAVDAGTAQQRDPGAAQLS